MPAACGGKVIRQKHRFPKELTRGKSNWILRTGQVLEAGEMDSPPATGASHRVPVAAKEVCLKLNALASSKSTPTARGTTPGSDGSNFFPERTQFNSMEAI